MDSFCILFRKTTVSTWRSRQEPGDSGWINLSQTLEKALADCRADPPCQLHLYVHEGSLKERNLDPAVLVSGVELADDDQVATAIAEARRMLIF